ncbi:MAG: V-type ATPase subunit [Candidatus Micrarchaeaceae archaeon]
MRKYDGAYGGISVLKTLLLSNGTIAKMSNKKMEEFVAQLYDTEYKKELDKLSVFFSGPDLIEAVASNHMALMLNELKAVLPLSVQNLITAYYMKYDIENIKAIISAKLLGYDTKKLITMLTSSEYTIGLIKSKDLSAMAEESLDEIIKRLQKFTYGRVIAAYEKEIQEGILTGMDFALDLFYFNNLLNEAKKSKSNVKDFVMDIIDKQNIMAIIKGISATQSFESLEKYIIKGGNIKIAKLQALAEAGMPKLLELLPFDISEAKQKYEISGKLEEIETAMTRSIYSNYIKKFESMPRTLEFIFGFIMEIERERYNVRAIGYSNYYNLNVI